MGLTLCMIVKNEALNLTACVESVRSIVDDIVIVDTGSSDGTPELARKLGARVYSFKWIDDFSVARNEALEYVETDWILSLDGDEKVSGKDHAAILELTRDDKVDGYFLSQRHYLDGAGYDNWKPVTGRYPEMEGRYPAYTENFAMRLFRRRPDIVYEGRVHENVAPADPANRWVVVKTQIVIHHFGKVGDRALLEGKKRAYLELCKLKAGERPEDPKAWFELGIQLHELGDFEGCLSPFEKSLELNPADSNPAYYIGNANYKLERYLKAREYLEKALKLDPKNADALVNLAGVERREGDVEKALDLFGRAIAVQKNMFAAWYNKAALLLSEGRNEEAEPCFDEALRLVPGYTYALFGQWQNEVALGKFRQACDMMLEWLKKKPELGHMVVTAVQNHLNRRDYQSAVESLRPIAGLIASSDGYAALGAGLLGLGETGTAERHLERAIAMDKKNNSARVNLAQLKELKQGGKKAAIALYRDALLYDPDNELCRKRLSYLQSV
ncbi:Glycosyl transferase, group 2 family [hydrothermal vent metagenome]|uniref:Glycosyl transferase, group 2 family n=1 Tax=hydrothermal vent metagenome TaxID=652676 RepID=A0A3B1BWK3_9ZZZZ